jgi:hypothetical protein
MEESRIVTVHLNTLINDLWLGYWTSPHGASVCTREKGSTELILLFTFTKQHDQLLIAFSGLFFHAYMKGEGKGR